jgi:hypothetical protein
MYREVTVDARGGHLVVASWWTSEGRYPMFLLGDWAERAEEPVDDAALGGLVREALKRCLVGVPMPDMRNDPDGSARLARLHKLGKARSARAYARTSRHVSLNWDDKKHTITLEPCQSDTGGGFGGIPASEIVVKDNVNDAELGRAVRQAIAAAKSPVERVQ